MVQKTLLTGDDLFEMGDDCHCELVEGRLVPMSPTGFEHGQITMRITLQLGNFVETNGLGSVCGAETGFRLRRDPDTVRAPDCAFVARGRVTPEMDVTRYLDLAPDLVVEVISPSESARDIAKKVREYLDAGVRMVWLAYPQPRSIVVHRPGRPPRTLSGKDELSGEDVLPGFACRVADLFGEPLT